MQNIALTWQQSAVLTGALLGTAVVLHASGTRTGRSLVPYAREIGVIAGLYALWQLAGELSVLGTSGAFARARWIENVQQDWHLPAESSVQHAITGHPDVVQACNIYYATMHFGGLFAFLLWLFLRHRDAYPRVRLTLVTSTLACLLLQLIPVAPPRLLPGYVDTARQYGQSVYSLGLAPDQLSAMPSVHVAWAVLVGWAVVRISTSRWRWLALIHPIVTVYVVVATANHFWLDGVVAIVVLALCAAAQRAGRVVRDRVRARSAGEPEPVLAAA